jgi:hypothetical protein
MAGEHFYPKTIRAKIMLFNAQQGKVREENNVAFEYQGDGTFLTTLPLDPALLLNTLYAIYVKPRGYMGKLFCSTTVQGSLCTTPQFILRDAFNDVNLTAFPFKGGDVDPASGKVDGYDLSAIMADLGKTEEGLKGDITSDGVVNVVDYTVALESIKENILDDIIPSSITLSSPTATPSPTLSVTPEPTTILVPTTVPQPTPTSSVMPTTPARSTPSPTTVLVPTSTPAPIPTTKLIPTSTPVPTPTSSTPKPTPSIKVPDYTKLAAFVTNPPQIGCQGGTTNGCPVDELYRTPLAKGVGWATYYGDEHNTGYNVVADVIHNNKGITVEAARKFINDNYMAKQSTMTPEAAKKTGKVIAFGATRSPQDLWKIKYAFGIDDPKNPKPYFIGRIMIIDCAASKDWSGNLATLTYSYKGWNKLNWIVDLSKNGFTQLPTGLSGVQSNTGEGRPGVILIDEGILDEMIY